MYKDCFGVREELTVGTSKYQYYSLPALGKKLGVEVSRLPISLRMVLESVLRHCGTSSTEESVRNLCGWQATAERTEEIPFTVARIILQDFTGVPLLVDLAAMRSAVAALGRDAGIIEPLVPVDLVVDHSVQTDVAGTPNALAENLNFEFSRNKERYELLKWGTQAFKTFRVIPPSTGIIHQVNLEFLASGVQCKEMEDGSKVLYPDTLVGTDSHTTMINGLGVVGWGVGGIEAEAGMLGQPLTFLTPDVVGVHLTGKLQPGVTATDVALTLTKLLRDTKVVGKFVEYFGEGASALEVPERAVIANMSPEYGATMGYFPPDEKSLAFLKLTGRSEELCTTYEAYYKAQGMFGIPQKGAVDYSKVVELDLSTVRPCVAGPKRPQDRIALENLGNTFREFVQGETAKKTAMTMKNGSSVEIGNGSILIAAITSCTNTSNPSLMLAAGLLAKKAVEAGLKIPKYVKTSLAPGSRVVTDYLTRSGLQQWLDKLGFNTVGYGCMSCIGNSGPLDSALEETVKSQNYVCASVLSGNRNFEARVHPSIRANFLMSPPLVVAFALAGRVDIDLTSEPIGTGANGQPVFLRDIFPTSEEIAKLHAEALKPESFQAIYANYATQNSKWSEIPAPTGKVFEWNRESTYIQEPPFFQDGNGKTFDMAPPSLGNIYSARILAMFGDSVTTDHISPAGAFAPTTPAGKYLIEHGVERKDFNSYGSRRGNDRVMTRGTFANVRIKNLMVPGTEGGITVHQPDKEQMSIYDAAQKYMSENTPLVVIGGREYGTGSSRDWAAKGTALLGVKAVLAMSFERIHRSNLVGMGILPLQFQEGMSAETLGLTGDEQIDIVGLDSETMIQPRQEITVRITKASGKVQTIKVLSRIDTPIEVEYYRHGGILPFVLRQLLQK